jgi:hypothetical protein
MRRARLILVALFFVLALIAIAVWPRPGPKVKLAVTPLGPSPDGSAQFIVGVTNQSSRMTEALVGRAVAVSQGGTAIVDEQRLVLAPASGMLVAVPVPGAGTSSWTLDVFGRQAPGRIESSVRVVGWRLKLLRSPYSPDFEHWKEVQMEIPRQLTNGLSQ